MTKHQPDPLLRSSSRGLVVHLRRRTENFWVYSTGDLMDGTEFNMYLPLTLTCGLTPPSSMQIYVGRQRIADKHPDMDPFDTTIEMPLHKEQKETCSCSCKRPSGGRRGKRRAT